MNWFHSSWCYSNSSKDITCPSGMLKTEFTSPIAKSTSPGLSDTTFFARCCVKPKLIIMIQQCYTPVGWVKGHCIFKKRFLVKVWRSNETLGKIELHFLMYLTGTFDFGLSWTLFKLAKLVSRSAGSYTCRWLYSFNYLHSFCCL